MGPQQPGAEFATMVSPSDIGPSIFRLGPTRPRVNDSTFISLTIAPPYTVLPARFGILILSAAFFSLATVIMLILWPMAVKKRLIDITMTNLLILRIFDEILAVIL